MNPYGLLFPAVLALVLMVISYRQSGWQNVGEGFKQGGLLFWNVLPSFLIGFTLAGFLMVVLPKDFVARLLGRESGFRGLLVGTVAGGLTPGGPFSMFPIMASLLYKGAAIGPITAFITAWSLIGLNRIVVWEAPILGWHFVLVRLLASLPFPVLIGFVAQAIADVFKVKAI